MDLIIPIGQQIKGTFDNPRLREKTEVFGIVANHEEYGKIVVQEDHSWLPLNKLGDIDLIGVNLYEVYKREAGLLLETYNLSELEPSDVPRLIEEIASTVTNTVGGPSDEEAAQDAAADALKTQIAAQANPGDVQKAAATLLTQESRMREATAQQIATFLANPERLVKVAQGITKPEDWGPILGAVSGLTPADKQTINNAAKAARLTATKLTQGNAGIKGVTPQILDPILRSIGQYLQLNLTSDDLDNAQAQLPRTASNNQVYQKAAQTKVPQ